MNYAKLNHVLIPPTKAMRDRQRRTLVGRVLSPMVELYWSTTIEGKTVFLLALLAGGFGLQVGDNDIYMVWAGLAGLLVASVLTRGPFHLRGVRMTVAAPRRVTVAEPFTLSVTLQNHTEREHARIQVAGPLLPWDGTWLSRLPAIAQMQGKAIARVQCDVRFAQRGHHHLDPFRAGAVAPFRLMLGELLRSEGLKFVVVPRIANIARIDTSCVRKYQPGGIALASKTGDSMEFKGVRLYRPGDPIRNLHARSWARRGVPVVREYQEEYFTRLGIIVDSDARCIRDPRQLEAVLSVTAGLVAHLGRSESLIDLLLVGDHVHTLTLGRSLGHIEQALDLLAWVQPGPRLSPEHLTHSLTPHLPQLSAILFVCLAWDSERARLVNAIRAHGTGCKTIVVDPPTDAKRRRRDQRVTTRSKDLVHIQTEAVERGEALVL